MCRFVPLLLAFALVMAGACSAPESVAPDAPSAAAEPEARAASGEAPRPAPSTGEPADSLPPTAALTKLAELRAERTALRHPADGGGRAWLEPVGEPVAVEQARRFELVYEAGPLGVALGGHLRFEASRWWYWSPPQAADPEGPGFTEARAAAPEVVLEARPADRGVAFELVGAALRPGQRVRLVYGAGPARARVDRFAEREARLNLFVDGDGDGVDALVEDGARLDVAAGPTAHVVLRWPSTAAPRAQAPLTVACLDRHWNAVTDCALELRLEALEGDARPPARVALTPDDAGSVRVAVALGGPGVHVLRARGPDGQVADSNPLLALPRPPRLLWGDLHGHSNLSDGTGTPEDYFRYARDVAALDVVALTDHDHIGFPALDRTPAHWERIRRAVEGFHEPGRFVALLGYEWTSWIHGHRHVLFFGDGGEVVSSADPRTESPLALWDALRGRPALTFAHHSAGGPIATNWAIPPDPELEPVTEIVSVHGSSESIDTPNPVHRPVRGNFVREALARGYRLGFVGSGDGHDGHPGLTRLGRPATGGLAGLWSESLTRDGAREALRARRVYATNGPRLLLRVTLDDAPMGALLPPAAERRLSVLVVGDGKLERIDVVRGRRVVHQVPGERRRRVGFSHTLRRLDAGEWVYVRAVQTDGGAAWSSPFFVEGPR